MLIDGYVRVSRIGGRSGERFISPTHQRQQIEGWATLHGALIGEVFEELDESGGRADRPLLQEAVARVERGESNGIVVAKLDRFGRSLTHGLAAIERIRRAGGTFVSVADGFDLSTDSGRLMLRFMLAMAEWELDRVRSNWAVANQRACARGVHSGPAPPGYIRRADGRLRRDPLGAPLITELFARRARGEPIAALARWLTSEGLPTATGGGHWLPQSVRALLRREVYLGQVSYMGQVTSGAHAPLVDRPTWQAAQRPTDMPALRARHGEPRLLLYGLLRCAGCRRLLTTCRQRSGQLTFGTYICIKQSSTGRCPERPSVRDTVVEPYVEALFWQELERRARPRAGSDRLDAASAEVAAREHELERYRDNAAAERALGAERFAAGLGVRRGRLERALLALAAARRETSAPELPSARELREAWPGMDASERRAAIGEVIDCVFVRRGKGRSEERLHACRRGQAPADLPRQRLRAIRESRPFDARDAGPPLRLTGADSRPWPRARLIRELQGFLEGRESFPLFPEWQAAGKALSFRQLMLAGGPSYWARRFELRYETEGKWVRHQSDAAIRAQLAPFVAGRTRFPTKREFEAAGLRSLCDAMRAGRGVKAWAAEFGLPLAAHGERRCSRWTTPLIEAALRPLVAGRESWPPKRVFVDAGLVGLYHAIGRQGQQRLWAERMGLAYRGSRARDKPRWSDEAIAEALEPLLRGRREFPRPSEFEAAGLVPLQQAIYRHPDGHAGWARRCGLPVARRTAVP